MRIVSEGVQGTSLGNLTHQKSLKMQVDVKVNSNQDASKKSSIQEISKVDKLKIIGAVAARNPLESRFNIQQDTKFNFDLAGGNTNFSSSRQKNANLN